MKQILKKVRTFAQENELFDPGQKLCAAVSGGACIRCVSTHASERPTMSLLDDSMIWLTAVGRISPRPWV